jgi:hypothetical protein
LVIFISGNQKVWHIELSLDEKRLTRARQKAAAPHRMGETEGMKKTGIREILLRHEGLAPVR